MNTETRDSVRKIKVDQSLENLDQQQKCNQFISIPPTSAVSISGATPCEIEINKSIQV